MEGVHCCAYIEETLQCLKSNCYTFCRWCQKKKREAKTEAEEFRAFHRVQVVEARKIKWSLDQR